MSILSTRSDGDFGDRVVVDFTIGGTVFSELLGEEALVIDLLMVVSVEEVVTDESLLGLVDDTAAIPEVDEVVTAVVVKVVPVVVAVVEPDPALG